MKKASQLDWQDLQQIAQMKGIQTMVPLVPLPASAKPECTSCGSEHEGPAVAVVAHVAQASVGAVPSAINSPHDPTRSGSEEGDPENP